MGRAGLGWRRLVARGSEVVKAPVTGGGCGCGGGLWRFWG